MKKLISAILSFALLVTCLIPFGIMTVSADEPTLITDQAGLANLSATGNYKLGNDITITGEWNNDVMFYGTLDGDGHTVTFADGATVNGGLFKQIREGSSFKNLNIVANNVTWKTGGELQGMGTYCIGGLVASIEAGNGSDGLPKYNDIGTITALANSVSIQNVHVTANFTTINADGIDKLTIGGVVGELGLICLIENCSFTGAIANSNRSQVDMQAYTSSCGGIVGSAIRNCGPVVISECVNNGNITGYGQVGGILGYCRGWGGGGQGTAPENLVIQKCVNNGKITNLQTDWGEDSDDGSKLKRASAGGIAGFVYAKDAAVVKILNNINYGEVIASGEDAKKFEAGICGVIRQREKVTVAGNINFDASKAAIVAGFLSSGKVTWENNYASSGGASDIYTTFATAGGISAVFSALNAAYPGVYLFEDDTIKLANSSFDSGSSTLDVPQALTMDVTVPSPTGTAITNQKELESMKADGIYYLANDIEIKATLKSVGEFSGVFHGNGHTIVINGAEVRGGLFKSLAGGKIYDLSITEAPGSGSTNSYRTLFAPNELDVCFGTVAGYGYGTIVNVTVDCVVGDALKNTSNAYVGGLIGVLTDGDSVLYNCYNTSRVQGGYVGGIIGQICSSSGKVEIARCVNWGECIASNGVAGGIFGMHGLTSSEIDISLLVLENVNYGAISSTGARYSGGIVGTMQSFWSGKASLLRNVNYGAVTANAADVGCPGGIIGYLKYEGVMISGNVNLGTVTGSKAPNSLVGAAEISENNVVENNFAAQAEIPATVGTVVGAVIDGNTVATLNAACDNAFVSGEQIALKWVADEGLSATAPKVTYTIVEDDGQSDDSGEQSENNSDSTTGSTEAPVTEEKKGCGSAIGVGGVIALLMLCGVGATVAIRRKED